MKKYSLATGEGLEKVIRETPRRIIAETVAVEADCRQAWRCS
jgi:hypothetical protein